MTNKLVRPPVRVEGRLEPPLGSMLVSLKQLELVAYKTELIIYSYTKLER
jgi:hypothetical protein